MFPWWPRDGPSCFRLFSNLVSGHSSFCLLSSSFIAGFVWLFLFHSLNNPNSFLPQDFCPCGSLCLGSPRLALCLGRSPSFSVKRHLSESFITNKCCSPASLYPYLKFFSDASYPTSCQLLGIRKLVCHSHSLALFVGTWQVADSLWVLVKWMRSCAAAAVSIPCGFWGSNYKARAFSLTSFLCWSFLVKCPEGSYFQKDICIPCPVGFYQEQAGSMACVSCPLGRTTISPGAFSHMHCKFCRVLVWKRNLTMQRGHSRVAQPWCYWNFRTEHSFWGLPHAWQDVYLGTSLTLTYYMSVGHPPLQLQHSNMSGDIAECLLGGAHSCPCWRTIA